MHKLFMALTCGLLTVAQAQQTIRMTAPVGTTLTGTLQSQTSVTVLGVEVQPKPNVRLTAQALEDYRKTFAVMPAVAPVDQTFAGTLEVLPALPEGGIPVQTKFTIPVSGQDPLQLAVRNVYLPDGTYQVEVNTSGDPATRQMLAGIQDVLNAPETQALYRKSWTPGEQLVLQQTVPMDKFLGTLPYRVTGALTLNTVLAYAMQNAEGEHLFQTSSTSGLNEIRAYDQDDRIVMKVFVANVQSSGQSRVRKDGLLSFNQLRQSMNMTLIMNLPDLPVTITARMKLDLNQIQNWN